MAQWLDLAGVAVYSLAWRLCRRCTPVLACARLLVVYWCSTFRWYSLLAELGFLDWVVGVSRFLRLWYS